MNNTAIRLTRIKNQKIGEGKLTAPELVAGMGAMQAQDNAMAQWAVGMRCSHALETEVAEQYDKGAYLRTHIMRPTWHLVAPEDIGWLLQLTAGYTRKVSASRDRELGITKPLLKKASRIIEQELAGSRPRTKDALIAILQKQHISADNGQFYYHIFLHAELDGLICSGPDAGKERTYMLLDERVTEKRNLDPEESLAELGRRYFTSHGPATIDDFSWWSGLPRLLAKKAVDSIEPDLHSAVFSGKQYYFSGDLVEHLPTDPEVYLLPAYDEYLISYKDRTAALDTEQQKAVISSNGIFRPVLLYNGAIVAVWSRVTKDKTLKLQVNFFRKPDALLLLAVEQAARAYGKFCGKPLVVTETRCMV